MLHNCNPNTREEMQEEEKLPLLLLRGRRLLHGIPVSQVENWGD